MRVKVQAEELVIGALVGAGVGLAALAPVFAGAAGWNPITAPGIGGFVQAAALWVGASSGAVAGLYVVGSQERDSHLRGARYIKDFAGASRAISESERKTMSVAQLAGGGGLHVGGVELSRTTEVGHMYVVGVPGSGKTVLLTSMIDEALSRGDRVLIHDPKGDFTSRYFDPAHAVLLGPWDERAAVWDAASDVDTPALADEFGGALAGKGEGNNKFFHDAAAVLIAGVLRAQMRAGVRWLWSDLRDALAQTPDDLVRLAAAGNAAVKTVMPSVFTGDDLTAGERAVLSVVGVAGQWVANYAAVEEDAERPRFALKRWLAGAAHEEMKLVILNNNANYGAAGAGIFGAMLGAAAACAASAEMPERSADEPGLWLILDELPQLGASALESVQKIEELGRSRGVRVVLAMQDESQLAAKIGREKAVPMLAVQTSKIYMKSSDRQADELSKRIGEREIYRLETVTENGQFAGKTKKLLTQRVVQPSDILGLRVRKDPTEPPQGVELILHIADVLGRLVQPWPARRDSIAEPLVESDAWKLGSLPREVEEEAPEEGKGGADGGLLDSLTTGAPQDVEAETEVGDGHDDDIVF